MTLQKSPRGWRAPMILACAAALAISPAVAAAQSRPALTARAAADPGCADAALAPDADDLPRISAAVLCLLNAERAGAGLAPLSLDAQLARASQPMADRMVAEQFFSHDTPDGRSLADRVRVTGYLPRSDSWVLGENLAWGSGTLATPQAIVNGWMNSPGHRANILARDYRDIGIGLAIGSPLVTRTGGAIYVTDFGERAPAVTPTRLKVSVPRHVSSKAARALARGVAFRASCSRRCTLVGRLFLNAKTARAAAHLRSADPGSLRLARAGHGTVTVQLTAKAKRTLRRLGHLTMTLVTTASGTSVTRTTRVTLT